MFRAGDWDVAIHGSTRGGLTFDPEPRGSHEGFLQSMFALRAARVSRTSVIELRTMLSADPVMGPEGYPLLLQTGETADGFTPLYDRQHPHDLFMEVAAALRVDITERIGVFLYAAPVGEPALGPTTYMHRASGRNLPATPISHHWLDATHISYGVATIGAIMGDHITLEVSGFNGREPDHHRWGIETPRFNSYSARVGVYPSRHWSVQVSGAHVSEPERIHPGMDIVRLTGTLAYARAWSTGSWHVTVAGGANKREALELQVGSVTVTVPARTQFAALAETSLTEGGSEITLRFEVAEKDELFPTLDARHNAVFHVGKLHAGYQLALLHTPAGSFRVGGAGALHILPRDLATVYGDHPVSFQLFSEWHLW